MLSIRLLRSARPLSRLVFHQTTTSLRISPSVLRPGRRFYSDSVTNTPPPRQQLPQSTSNSTQEEQPDEPKYSITFTCKVPECDERTSHMFSKRAYHHGIVIIQCPKCKNRHLIADNLGWFKDERTGQGSQRNIEEIMRSKGQQVTKGRFDAGGVVEYTE